MTTSYLLIDLGTLYAETTPNAINNQGVVSGTDFNSPLFLEAPFRYKGNLQQLQLLPGMKGGGVFGMNNRSAEQIVGYVESAGGGRSPAIWTDGQYAEIPGLPGGSVANDINDSGIVVGDAGKAFRLDLNIQQVETFLPSGDVSSQAVAVNAQGNVVGHSDTVDGYTRGFLFDATKNSLMILPTLTEKGPGSNFVADINDANIVVGRSWNGYLNRAFYYDYNASKIYEIPGAEGHESTAYDINNQNVVVGSMRPKDKTDSASIHAMIWRWGEPMQKLNDMVVNGLGWHLNAAFAINDNGQIVGRAYYYDQQRGFLLTPVDVPWYEQDLPLPTLVARILIGLIHGGSGFIFLPGSGVTPVDPEPFRRWAALAPNEKDVLMGLAIHELASIVGDAEARRKIEISGLETIKKAVDELLRETKKRGKDQDSNDR